MKYLSFTHEMIAENGRMLLIERFGFTEEEAKSVLIHNKYISRIPVSFLVRIFMRKLQDGMDRCRP